MYKESYGIYLRQVRGNSSSTVKHYYDALKWISNYLNGKGVLTGSVYDVRDYDELIKLKEILYLDEEFKIKDEIGHHMYSCGLNNYCSFAEGSELFDYIDKLEVLDVPIDREETTIIQQNRYARNPINKRQVIRMSAYKCSIDNNHFTFTNKANEKPYMEGHHLIPMRFQKDFENSLDVYANIVCLCPLCHRKLHYAINDERVPLLRTLYDERCGRLGKSGIKVSKIDFIDSILTDD